jgi:hypothetical protein
MWLRSWRRPQRQGTRREAASASARFLLSRTAAVPSAQRSVVPVGLMSAAPPPAPRARPGPRVSPAGALPEPVRVRSAVAQPGAAEPDGRVRDDHLLDRVHRLVSHSVAAYLVRSEGPGRQPVSVQAAVPHAPQPGSLHDMDPARGAVPEEPLAILRRGGRPRLDASPGAIPREPEHRSMTGINRPYQRRCRWVRSRRTRPERAERRVLTEVPQRERAFPVAGRRRSRASRCSGQSISITAVSHAGQIAVGDGGQPVSGAVTPRRAGGDCLRLLPCAAPQMGYSRGPFW